MKKIFGKLVFNLLYQLLVPINIVMHNLENLI